MRPRIRDGTSAEDLAIFLEGWRRHIDWALREDPATYSNRLHQLLHRLEEHLGVLRSCVAMPDGDFLTDPWKVKGAQLHLLLAFTAAVDVAKWLAGRVRMRDGAQGRKGPLGRPRSFADAFDLLVRAGMLPGEKRHVYIGLARLRNWITHEAVSLPPAKIRAFLRFYLPELEAFAACLRQHGR